MSKAGSNVAVPSLYLFFLKFLHQTSLESIYPCVYGRIAMDYINRSRNTRHERDECEYIFFCKPKISDKAIGVIF
jgi:hypothetical protein